MPNVDQAGVLAYERLTELVYELLDAHGDTQQLAAGLTEQPGWEAHLDYLRCLQRVGRQALAEVTAQQAAPVRK